MTRWNRSLPRAVVLFLPVLIAASVVRPALAEEPKEGPPPVFASKALLLDIPDSKGKTLAELQAGDRVKVAGATVKGESLLFGQDEWSSVALGEKRGMIWSGHLARAWKDVDLDGDGKNELLMVGLLPGEDGRARMALRVMSGRAVLAGAEGPQLSDAYFYQYRIDYKGQVPGFPAALRWFAMAASKDAEEYSNPVLLFAWDGKKLHGGPKIEESYGNQDVFVFPKEEGGQPDSVVAKHVSVGEEGDTSTFSETWTWKDGALSDVTERKKGKRR